MKGCVAKIKYIPLIEGQKRGERCTRQVYKDNLCGTHYKRKQKEDEDADRPMY